MNFRGGKFSSLFLVCQRSLDFTTSIADYQDSGAGSRASRTDGRTSELRPTARLGVAHLRWPCATGRGDERERAAKESGRLGLWA